MRYLFLSLLLIITSGVFAQKSVPDSLGNQRWYHLNKTDYTIMGLQVVSGAASGFRDMLAFHPHTFERLYPNSNLDWWIPSRSQGSHKLIMIRDGVHMAGAIEHGTNYLSIGVSLLDVGKLPAKDIIKKAIFRTIYSYALNRIAFNGVYKLWFNDRIERERAGR